MENVHSPDQIIDALGGTSKAAEICEISASAVSQWRGNGIPKAQMKFLRLRKPEVFARLDGMPLARRATDTTPATSHPGQPSTTSTAPAGATAIPTGEIHGQ